MSDTALTGKTLEMVARRFRYLGEPFRLRLLQSLRESEKTVTELVEELDATQPNVSKHLNLLLEGGLVARRKHGTSSIYSIADPLIFTLCDLVCRREVQRSRQELAMLEHDHKRLRRVTSK